MCAVSDDAEAIFKRDRFIARVSLTRSAANVLTQIKGEHDPNHMLVSGGNGKHGELTCTEMY
jgi:hypothetical protein